MRGLNRTAAAIAGTPSRGDQALYKTWAEILITEDDKKVALWPGVFLARHKTKEGVAVITSKNDIVAGLLIRTGIYRVIDGTEPVDVMRIGHGDGAWVQMIKDAALTINSPVYIVATGEDAGKVTDVATDNIATPYIVIKVRDGLAEITRREDR